MTINLDTLSKEELLQLKNDVDKALKTLDTRRKAEAKKAAETIAKEYGYSLNDLIKEAGVTKGVARYANPEDPSQTWTGRGRKPGWVIAAIQAGKNMEDLEI